jgi:hypothetical protein
MTCRELLQVLSWVTDLSPTDIARLVDDLETAVCEGRVNEAGQVFFMMTPEDWILVVPKTHEALTVEEHGA